MPESATVPQLHLNIVSDVVCPWCVIGYRQFLQAQAELERRQEPVAVRTHWQPFQLNPDMPAEGQDLAEHIAGKYGSTSEEIAQTRSRLTALGEDLGFRFRFFDGMRIHNTFKAHQLLHWAGQIGRQTELKMALFSSYFTHRGNPDNEPDLLEAVGQAGLDRDSAAVVLRDQRFAATVSSAARGWMERGVRGVPAFVFNQQHLVSGAQGRDTFINVLQQLTVKQ